MNTLTVNNAELVIREWNGNRVLTFSDIDRVHGRISGTAKRNFLKNKKYMLETVDYYKLSMDEIRPLATDSNYNYPKGAIVLTKSGYLMIVKSLNDPKAWDVQRNLVNAYFMLEAIAEQKTEEQCQELPSVSQPLNFEAEFKRFLEHQSSLMKREHEKNEEFRQTMLDSFSAMAKIIIHQSRMIEQLYGNKHQISVVETVEEKEVKTVEPIYIELAYDTSKYKLWAKNINSLLYGKDRSRILSDTYNYMNKKYGICWEQEQKEFSEANGRQSKNTMELIFWMESNKTPLKGLFESCMRTIMEKDIECKETKLVYPIKNFEEFKKLSDYIAEQIGDKSPNHSVFFRRFFRFVDSNNNIKWIKFENKYRKAHDIRNADRVSKISMMDFSPTVKKICISAFNEFVVEQYKDIISTL